MWTFKYWRITGRGEAFQAQVVNYADDFVILSRRHAAEALNWTLPDPSHGTYRGFELVYCQLIEDRTWEHTNNKHPPVYVNRVRVQMQHRYATNSIPADANVFPYLLAWVFLWNDEERIRFTVEFLVR